jgi:hypothetical protein
MNDKNYQRPAQHALLAQQSAMLRGVVRGCDLVGLTLEPIALPALPILPALLAT